MASFFKGGGLALALIILIVVISSSFQSISVADARSPRSSRARQLATDCNSPRQSQTAGCESGDGTGSGVPSRPGRPGVATQGSSRCRKGCCGRTIRGACRCCN